MMDDKVNIQEAMALLRGLDHYIHFLVNLKDNLELDVHGGNAIERELRQVESARRKIGSLRIP